MEGVVALGHFCETHGPIVIFSTERTNEQPEDKPQHINNSPICDSCKSINAEDAIVSDNNNKYYVSTRLPLNEETAFLLKNAVVKSISCEEMGKEGGLMYFGDSQRGHVITLTFYLADSQARGFIRKYCLLILLRDKVHLLNNWPHLTKHFKTIADYLKENALKINSQEQLTCSQKAARQALQQTRKNISGRSLQQLTGVESIFMELHMWFVWLLSVNSFEEIQSNVEQIPIKCDRSIKLRNLYRNMSREVFHKVCYCILTGIKVECDTELMSNFKQILPTNFKLPQTGDACKLLQNESKWEIQWRGNLPLKLPSLLTLIDDGLNNASLPDEAIESYLVSFCYKWYNIASNIACIELHSQELLEILGVHKYDMPLLSYWTTQIRNSGTEL